MVAPSSPSDSHDPGTPAGRHPATDATGHPTGSTPEIPAPAHPPPTPRGCNRHGLTPDVDCPECATKVAHSLAYPPSDTERLKSSHPPCLRCGYDLHGLTPDADCPECGAPVQRSLRGNLLRFSAPEYLQSLSTGLLLILVAVISQIAISVLSVAGMMVLTIAFQNPAAAGVLENIIAVCSFGIMIISFVGWWMFSAPDPAIVGQDQGDSPRKILRVAIVVILFISLIYTVSELFFVPAVNLMLLSFVAGGLYLIAWVGQFFASLLYVRWMAKRIPSRKIHKRAELYMWLLPLIYVAGFCLGFIGPIIATVMYCFLLFPLYGMIRESIRQQQAEEETIVSENHASFA